MAEAVPTEAREPVLRVAPPEVLKLQAREVLETRQSPLTEYVDIAKNMDT